VVRARQDIRNPATGRSDEVSPRRLAPDVATVLALQRGAGNAAVSRAILARAAPEPAAAAAPALEIKREGPTGRTFVTTDSITLSVDPPTGPEGEKVPVDWSVTGVSADAGSGDPAGAKDESTFTFTPTATNRPVDGARAPNAPIAYRVEAIAGEQKATFELKQDEVDTMRQEYVDYGADVPARGSFVNPEFPGSNVGNYSKIVDGGIAATMTGVASEWARLTNEQAVSDAANNMLPEDVVPGTAPLPRQDPDPGIAPLPVQIPELQIESGYRNPQRNNAAGSQYLTTSKHIFGRALDLYPAGGADAELWARLEKAGEAIGDKALCEDGATPTECSDPKTDHVHVQW
jgi:hypothetical protein